MNVIANCITISEPTAQDQDALGTGWMDILLTAFNRMIAEDIIEPADDDEEPDPWAADMPGWRRAAAEYHRHRDGRTAIVETPNENAMRAAAAATIDAMVFSLRRGVGELAQPDTVRRLSMLDPDQLKTVCRRVQAFQPGIAQLWSTSSVDELISAWRKSR
jgi:hypothetical protein